MRSPYNPWNVAALNPQIGGGGATTLAALTDVNLGTPADNDVLTYDSGTSKWISQAPTPAAGSSVAWGSKW